MRRLARSSIVALCALLLSCATTRESPRPRFRPQVSVDALSAKRASAKHAQAMGLLATGADANQLGEAVELLDGACSEGHVASCDLLREHSREGSTDCVPKVRLSRMAREKGVTGVTRVRCRVSAEGLSERCDVLVELPYDVTDAFVEHMRNCRWTPATFQGKPHPSTLWYNLKISPPTAPTPNGWVPLSDPLVEARERVMVLPNNPSAWRHLALLLERRGERGPEFTRALERAAAGLPDDPRLQAAQARVHLAAGRTQDAFRLALRAVRQDGWEPSTVETYAAASALAGHCPEAVRAQRHALELLPSSASSQVRLRMEGRLAEYEKACTVPPPRPQ